jgi:pimeloyl-ACP methyl ester carboxylesterase
MLFPVVMTLLLLILWTGVCAGIARIRIRYAESVHPPSGQFLVIDGVKLHYTDQGQGAALVILHGNGGMVEEINLSGLATALARTHRILVFDRPGFGHSSRPRRLAWTAEQQAALIHKALQVLTIRSCGVIGHSWGTLVALAMAVERPNAVNHLVLMGGYYFPLLHRAAEGAAVLCRPIIGHVLRHVVLPILGDAAMWRIIQKCFEPESIPPSFWRFPISLALRPSQLFAGAQDGTTMKASAQHLSPHYGRLSLPVLILAGESDRIIATADHSVPLHMRLPNSRLIVLAGIGHMLHHTQLKRVVAEIQQHLNDRA